MSTFNRQIRVFLCHASADKPNVRKLYRYLKRHGVQPWFDEEDLVAGQDWQVEIPKALRRSDAVIICLTKNSVDKEGYVQKEIKFAFDKALEIPEGRVFLIPVRFEECQVPSSLRDYQWVDLFNKAGYTKLLLALKLRVSQLGTVNMEAAKRTEPSETKVSSFQANSIRVLRAIGKGSFFAVVGVSVTALMIWLWSSAKTQGSATPTPAATRLIVSSQVPADQTPAPEPSPVFPSEIPDTPLPDNPSILTGKDGALLLYIPAGKFIMGSNSQRLMNEYPAHSADLDAYWIHKTEVTNGLFKLCVQSGECKAPPDYTQRFDNPSYSDYPVVYVSWENAYAYCEWVGGRLPTEAEWEKAARGTGEEFPWGKDLDCSQVNYLGCEEDISAVGKYSASTSPYGVQDMAGNVWEWVADWYDEGYYLVSPVSNPQGPTSGDSHVVRGAQWDPYRGLTSSRGTYAGLEGNDTLGFRCVIERTP